MAVFDSNIMKTIVDIEGGYVNDPDDPGGETKYGISKARYPNYDIKNLTISEAEIIYRRDFWDYYHLSGINSQNVANKILLALINMNPYDAITGFQEAICYLKPIKRDGVIGAETIEAVNSLMQIGLLLELISLRYIKNYTNKVVQNRRKEKYFFGWVRRALL